MVALLCRHILVQSSQAQSATTHQLCLWRVWTLCGEIGCRSSACAGIGGCFGGLSMLPVCSTLGGPAEKVDGFSYTALNVNLQKENNEQENIKFGWLGSYNKHSPRCIYPNMVKVILMKKIGYQKITDISEQAYEGYFVLLGRHIYLYLHM